VEKIVARFTWTVEDLLTARSNLPVGRSISILYFICGLILAVSGFDYMQRGLEGGRFSHLFFASLGVMIWIFLRPLIQRLILRRRFKDRPDANEEITYIFSEEAVQTSSPKGESSVQWSAFHKALFTDQGVLLMPNHEIFYFIPNRAFHTTKDIALLKGLLRSKVRHFKEA
jgi:hypothetical protein